MPFTALVLALSSLQATPATHFEGGGFHDLFDGESLAGWVTAGGRYDGHPDCWSVEDGLLVGREGPGGEGGLIYTEPSFANFAFAVDVRIDWPFDSGIFLRMAPEGRGAQVTIDYRDGGEIGGIYSDGWLQHNPTGIEGFRRDAWNRFEVLCFGEPMRIRAWLNGAPLVEHTVAASEGFAPRGLIGLQVHGAMNAPPDARVRFRNIRVRELPEFDADRFDVDERGFLTPKAAAREAGWRTLLDGTLDAWEPYGGGGGYALEDGVLAFLVEGSSPYLRTKDDFRDFELRLDFKTAFMANSGLFLRGARTDQDPAYSGCEVQILDDFNWERVTGSELRPYQLTGSLYGAVPAGDHGALRPIGWWNTYEVRYVGPQLTVRLNGVELYDVDTHALDARPPFADRAPTGFLGLQRHAPAQVEGRAYAWFRNVFVREL